MILAFSENIMVYYLDTSLSPAYFLGTFGSETWLAGKSPKRMEVASQETLLHTVHAKVFCLAYQMLLVYP